MVMVRSGRGGSAASMGGLATKMALLGRAQAPHR